MLDVMIRTASCQSQQTTRNASIFQFMHWKIKTELHVLDISFTLLLLNNCRASFSGKKSAPSGHGSQLKAARCGWLCKGVQVDPAVFCVGTESDD